LVVGREQHRHLRWPALQSPLLAEDQLVEFAVDRDQRLPFHFPVEVPQVGGAVGVGDQAGGRDLAGVGDAQAAAHQDHGDEPVVGPVPPVLVVAAVQLGHDLRGERAGQSLGAPGVVLGEEHRAGREGAVVPAVLADGGQEAAQRGEVLGMAFSAAHRGVQVGQVCLQQRPVYLGQAVDAGGLGGEELAEPGQGRGCPGDGAAAPAGGQLPPGPPLGQGLQPGLGDLPETDRGRWPAGAQFPQPPGVSRVLDVPALPERQRLDPVVGAEGERAPPVPGPGRVGALPPVVFGLVQH